MTAYERRRRQIAQREYAKIRNSTSWSSFDSWYTGSFLTDLLWIELLTDEIGTEDNYEEPADTASDTSDDIDTSDDHSSSDTYDDSSSDSFDSGGDDF